MRIWNKKISQKATIIIIFKYLISPKISLVMEKRRSITLYSWLYSVYFFLECLGEIDPCDFGFLLHELNIDADNVQRNFQEPYAQSGGERGGEDICGFVLPAGTRKRPGTSPGLGGPDEAKIVQEGDGEGFRWSPFSILFIRKELSWLAEGLIHILRKVYSIGKILLN